MQVCGTATGPVRRAGRSCVQGTYSEAIGSMHALLLILCLATTPGGQSPGDGKPLVIENGRVLQPPAPFVPPAATNLDSQPSVIWRAREPRKDTPPNQTVRPDDRDVVYFAADSVEFRLPLGWQVRETPFLHDVYLQLGPSSRFSRDPREGTGGAWIRYSPLRHTSVPGDPAAELGTRLQAAIATLPRVGEPRSVNVGGFPGLLQEFQLPLGGGTVVAAAHLVALTPWGVFELRTTEAQPGVHTAFAGANEILNSLRFHSPAPEIGAGKPAADQATAAATIFGTWKAINGRLLLVRDGRVALELDRTPEVRTAAASSEADEPKVLIGRYQAQGNELRITWEDGSRTDYTWRLDGEQLLLTDRQGRESPLAPAFD